MGGRGVLLALGLTAAATDALADDAPADAPPPAIVTVQADKTGVVLQHGDEKVCEAPCTAFVKMGDSYRIGGEHVTPHDLVFYGTTRLDVHAGNVYAHNGGILLTIVGATSMVFGLFAHIFGTMQDLSSAFCWSNCNAHEGMDLHIAGDVLLGAGLLGLAIGIPLIVTTKTSVRSGGFPIARTSLEWSANGLSF